MAISLGLSDSEHLPQNTFHNSRPALASLLLSQDFTDQNEAGIQR